MKTVVLGEWLQKARTQLRNFPEISVSSVHAIVGFVLNKPSHFALSHPEFYLSPSDEKKLYIIFYRLLAGEPLPYLIEKQEFFGIDFKVSAQVLIPRPETELLVEFALNWLKTKKYEPIIADVGTGSGCIAVSLAVNHPMAKIIGTDFSFNSLLVAKENINKYALKNQIHLVQSDLMDGLEEQFDCICANLPYIPTDTLSTLAVRKYEPLRALDGGKDGFRFIEPFLNQSQKMIKPDGLILMEIEATLSQPVSDLAAFVFPGASIKIHLDLAGLPRLIQIQLTGD